MAYFEVQRHNIGIMPGGDHCAVCILTKIEGTQKAKDSSSYWNIKILLA